MTDTWTQILIGGVIGLALFLITIVILLLIFDRGPHR